MSTEGTTRRVRRALALPLAAVLLAAGATTVLARPETRDAMATTAPATEGFTITSALYSTPSGPYPASACTGASAVLTPGDVRCVLFTIHNPQPTAIRVTSITSSLGPSAAALPAECVGAHLELPSFLGALDVPAGGSVSTVGVPMRLLDSGTNQDACKGITYDLVFAGSSTEIVTGAVGTAASLQVAPAMSLLASPVRLTATVAAHSGSRTPVGTVRFFVRTLTSTPRLLGTAPLSADGTAGLDVSTLSVGDSVVYAAYDGTADFGAATSAGVAHAVVRAPTACVGPFSNVVARAAADGVVAGTSGNDFVYVAVGAVTVDGGAGDDCVQTGTGTQVLRGGSGNDIIVSGDGRKIVDAGTGNNTIVLGSGSSRVVAGNGTNRVTLATGTGSYVRLGDGRGSVALGAGSRNTVVLGNGRYFVQVTGRGSYNTVRAGRGGTTVWFGTGTHNVFVGVGTGNVCHVPKPPRSWRGKPAAYYRDTLVNCRVVTP